MMILRQLFLSGYPMKNWEKLVLKSSVEICDYGGTILKTFEC